VVSIELPRQSRRDHHEVADQRVSAPARVLGAGPEVCQRAPAPAGDLAKNPAGSADEGAGGGGEAVSQGRAERDLLRRGWGGGRRSALRRNRAGRDLLGRHGGGCRQFGTLAHRIIVPEDPGEASPVGESVLSRRFGMAFSARTTTFPRPGSGRSVSIRWRRSPGYYRHAVRRDSGS